MERRHNNPPLAPAVMRIILIYNKSVAPYNSASLTISAYEYFPLDTTGR